MQPIKMCTGNNSSLPEEILDIFLYLSQNDKIMFKSQQRDEPELILSEKINLAKDVYRKNPQIFLLRFGNYLEEKHLDDFSRFSLADSDEEMHLMVDGFKNKLKTRQRDVKNRRYAALQKLVDDGEYFSESEMMKRSPELYQDLVGQYLSEEEKKLRDTYDVKATSFSGILMHSLEQKQITEIMEKAEQQMDEMNEQPANEDSDDQLPDDDIPTTFRQQWGNFDNEQMACSTSKIQKVAHNQIKTDPQKGLITAGEREILRQEFLSQMHEQFLSGNDTDFDYAAVDDNTQFDNLEILNQDEEDKYFEESEDDDESCADEDGKENVEKTEDSEDELDIYMEHLNKHHSLQK